MAHRRTTGGNRGADGRQTKLAATMPTPKATAPTSAAGSHSNLRRPSWPVPIAVACLAAVVGVTSAAANSAAVAKRSAGSLASAVSTASSTAGGTLRRWAMRPAGSAVITLATMACAVGPVNGGSPTSIS